MENENLRNQNRATVATQFFDKLHRCLTTLGSHWWVLVLGAGVGVGIEVYIAKHAPPSYVSIGRMIVGSKMSLSSASAYSEDMNNFLGTQVALMQSDVVSNRAIVRLKIEKPDLRNTPVAIKVTVSPKTSIFNFNAAGSNPEYVSAFLETVMEEYAALKKEMLHDASDTTKTGLQQMRTNLAMELQSAKQDLITYGANNKEVYLQDQGNSAGNYLAGLTKQLADLQSELQLLNTLTLDENAERLVGLSQSFDSQGGAMQAQTPSSITPTSVGLAQPGQLGVSSANSATSMRSVSQIGMYSSTTPTAMSPTGPRPAQSGSQTVNRNQSHEQASSLVGSEGEYLKAKQVILMMKEQKDEFGKYLRPKHPKIIALNEDIERMEKLLDIFRDQTKQQLKDRQHTLEVQIANLENDIKIWEVKTVDISKKMADYQAIKDRIVRLQNVSDSLFTTESTVNLTTQISPESVSILESATPGVLAKTRNAQFEIIAALLGLAAATGLLILRDRFDDRPHSFTELEDLFDEVVLGQIPRVPVKDKSIGAAVLQEDDDRHAFVESYRNLRSSIIFLGTPETRPKTILVTSAIPGDGKSMTAANLAITLARCGSRVLLIDADLRRGMLHKRFGLPAGPGMAEALKEERSWTSVVVEYSIPNLFIIPRGTVPKHPGELLTKPIRGQILKEAVQKYEYVLIDSPPIMAADDVSNLAAYVDGVLMVIRANHTSGRVARAALDLLYMRKAAILGIVFNGVRSSGGDYYYYKYKEYYSKTSAA